MAARERLRTGSKQMATYQAVAQTQSSSKSSNFVLLSCYTNLVCSRLSLAPTHYPLCINELLLYGAHIHSVDLKISYCYSCTNY